MESPPRVAVVDDRVFEGHECVTPHPERAERLAAARAGLRAVIPESRWLRLEPAEATPELLATVHQADYVERIRSTLETESHGSLDGDTYFGPGTRDAAFRAAGGAAALAEALLRGEADRGFALLRPPGHHAEPDRCMGFCLFNNVAVAAQAALAAGAARVAIVDWDVHHGNGTQTAFEEDDRVLFISLHQYPLYPGTGRPEEIGLGRGAGATMNVALPGGSGDETYGHAFRSLVEPAVMAHAPDLILVSAGYDAHARDPLAEQELSADAFGAFTTSLVRVAESLGHGRVGFVLEGGYDLQALHDSVVATARAAVGERVALPEDAAPAMARACVMQTLAHLGPHATWHHSDRMF